MTLEEAIKRINLGNCILFTGAGFSAEASISNGGKIGSVTSVAKELYAQCGEEIGDDGTLDDAAKLYSESQSQAQLLEFLRDRFTAVDVTESQKYIGSLQWKRIYTTNYDNVVEMAYLKNGRRITSVSASNDISDFADKQKLCIHINGLIQNLSEQALFGEFKLLNVSYTSAEFKENPWSAIFRSDIKSSDAIFFVGFSLKYDLDLQRILAMSPEIQERCFFIVSPQESTRSIRKLQEFGSVVCCGIDGFVKKIKTTPSQSIKLPTHYFCFDLQTNNVSLPIINAQKVNEFYLWGNIDKSALFYSTISQNEYKYIVCRECIKEILSKIENGSTNILIHSGLGNGKSLILQILAILLTQKGYSVYKYTKYYTTESREVEKICKDGKSVIIVDNYAQNRELLENIRNFRNDQIIIVADRTLVNDIAYYWLSELFGDFDSINVEKLSEEDMSVLSSIFTYYGLFGERASAREDQKIAYLRYDCYAKICPILIDLLDAPIFKSRIKELVADIKQNTRFYEAFIFCLLSPIFQYTIDTDELSFIFDDNQLNSPKFTKNANVREVVDFTNGIVSVHSTILAKEIIKEIDSTTIIDVLCKVFKTLDKQRNSGSYAILLRTLLSHSNIQRVVNPNGDNQLRQILRFYNTILPLEYCRSNHHFWLQFAIAELFAKDYPNAKIYFDNAYSFAKEKHSSDIYQIDNHFARYLLENECVNGSQSTCLQVFLKAHRMLVDPIHKERVRFYPYRVADNYYGFYERFYQSMENFEKKEFIKSCAEMYNRSQWYLEQDGDVFVRKSEVKKVSNRIRAILEETGNEKLIKEKNTTRANKNRITIMV